MTKMTTRRLSFPTRFLQCFLLVCTVILSTNPFGGGGGSYYSCCSCCYGLSLLDRRHALRNAGGLLIGTATTTANTAFPASAATTIDTVDATVQPDLLQTIPSIRPNQPSKTISIPRIGYSLYKTELDQVPRCIEVALDAGIRHFDVATQYGSNEIVGKALQEYIKNGNKKQRRQELFVHHKISNDEQSTSIPAIQRSVKKEMSKLGFRYLDLCSIHSPLANPTQRLCAYQALLELQKDGLVRAVGVCHFGVGPLNDLVHAGYAPPSVIQLVLSPFQQHRDIVSWAEAHGSAVSCNAWSRLSSTDGPAEGWAVLAGIGERHGKTKAQTLVRWALQKGYLCVPRSASKYKIERQAIGENSYGGVADFVLTREEMETLDGLDVQLPAGQLGVVDGWRKEDIVDAKWDPTNVV